MEFDPEARLYLVGIRIEPDIWRSQLYTIYVDCDRPIMSNQQPIAFTRLELAEAALAKSNCGASSLGPAPTELYTVYDICAAVYTLQTKDEDEDCCVLNLLNFLLDIVNCVGEPMPADYRRLIEPLADHLTFNNEFKSYLESNGISRQSVCDAIYWMLGMSVYWMKVVA